MVKDDKPRQVADTCHDVLDHVVFGRDRQGNRRHDRPGTCSVARLAHGVSDGVVSLIGRQNFVTRHEEQTGKNGVHTCRRVLDEDPVGPGSSKKPGNTICGLADPLGVDRPEKAGRIRVELCLNGPWLRRMGVGPLVAFAVV